jgi:hypothetical protein
MCAVGVQAMVGGDISEDFQLQEAFIVQVPKGL